MAMRKLKLQVQISLDGFIAGPNGEMDWMMFDWDEDLKEYVRQITDSVDCILLGRKLAQGFIPHWASHPEEEGAEKINNTPKLVFSNTLDHSEWDNTILLKGDLTEQITQLKKQEGKDIIVYGGADFVSSLIKADLIDEYNLLVDPTAIGEGMPIFKKLDSKLNLQLKKSIPFDCGITLLCYESNHS